MQGSLIERHGKELVTEGGFSERMTAARVEEKRRRQEPTETAAPSCPLCGGEMRLRHGKKGDFWGCQACLTCRGTREVQQQTD